MYFVKVDSGSEMYFPSLKVWLYKGDKPVDSVPLWEIVSGKKRPNWVPDWVVKEAMEAYSKYQKYLKDEGEAENKREREIERTVKEWGSHSEFLREEEFVKSILENNVKVILKGDSLWNSVFAVKTSEGKWFAWRPAPATREETFLIKTSAGSISTAERMGVMLNLVASWVWGARKTPNFLWILGVKVPRPILYKKRIYSEFISQSGRLDRVIVPEEEAVKQLEDWIKNKEVQIPKAEIFEREGVKITFTPEIKESVTPEAEEEPEKLLRGWFIYRYISGKIEIEWHYSVEFASWVAQEVRELVLQELDEAISRRTARVIIEQ